jgi:protein-disulfide isomerase
MTQEKFDQCIDNDELGNQILQGRIDVQAEFKIQSTPSFIINGVLIGGDKTIKEFRQIIDKILSE